MSDQIPAYGVFVINVDGTGELPPGNTLGPNGAALGQQTIAGDFNYLRLIDATDQNGNFYPLARLNVIVGRRSEAGIPLRMDGKIAGPTTTYQVQWIVQPAGFRVTAFAAKQASLGAGDLDVEAPPNITNITSSTGTTITTNQILVGTAPVLIVPAASTRTKCVIQNLAKSHPGFIGGPTVSDATGIILLPGESINLDGSTAAIWAIADFNSILLGTLVEQ